MFYVFKWPTWFVYGVDKLIHKENLPNQELTQQHQRQEIQNRTNPNPFHQINTLGSFVIVNSITVEQGLCSAH